MTDGLLVSEWLIKERPPQSTRSSRRRDPRSARQAATFTIRKTAWIKVKIRPMPRDAGARGYGRFTNSVLPAGPGRMGDRTGRAGLVRLCGRDHVLPVRLGPRHRDNRPTGRSSGFRLVAIPGQPSPDSVQHRLGVASRPGLWPITAAALRRIRTGFPLRPPERTGRTCRERITLTDHRPEGQTVMTADAWRPHRTSVGSMSFTSVRTRPSRWSTDRLPGWRRIPDTSRRGSGRRGPGRWRCSFPIEFRRRPHGWM